MDTTHAPHAHLRQPFEPDLELPSDDVLAGVGKPVVEQRELPAFQALRLECAVHVVVAADLTPGVVIETEANLLEHIRTVVEGDGTLRVFMRRACTPLTPITVRVSGPGITEITNCSDASIVVEDLHTPTVAFVTKGAGGIRAVGGWAVERVDAEVVGAGSISIAEIRAGSAELAVRGAGHLHARVEESVTAEVSGAGNIEVHGKPSSRRVGLSGTGRTIFF